MIKIYFLCNKWKGPCIILLDTKKERSDFEEGEPQMLTGKEQIDYAFEYEELNSVLFEKIAQGEREAFYTVYQQTKQAVYGFALSILRCREDAEDVMQDTYLKIRENAANYKEQGKPLAWILTITRNLAYMKLREKQKNSRTELSELENVIEFTRVVDVEQRVTLEKAFDVLSAEERQIVMLHAVTGLKHKEIGEILHKPLATVLSKYSRALKKLEKELDERKR